MDETLKDERFAHIAKDPRFRSIPKKERKVRIDRRFQSMFTDKRFKLKYTMDKRGRPIQHTTSEDLKKFYELSSSESDEEEEGDSGVEATPSDQEQHSDKLSDHMDKNVKVESRSKAHAGKVRTATRALKHCSVSDENRDARDSGQSDGSHFANKSELLLVRKKQIVKSKGRKTGCGTKSVSPRLSEDVRHESSSSECSDNEENDASEDENKMEMSFDLARGEGNVESSTTDDSTSESEDEDGAFDHKWGELDADAPKAEEVTHRLAVCNMDWDRIKAQDLFVLLNSFKPVDGVIHSVTIYPSEYGLGRIKEEEVKGPPELVEKTLDSDEEGGNENEDGSMYHTEKLRQYQLNRLKYYYAVVECDSPETANKLYEELDGMEYESSSACFDLRFIPDDMSFDQEAISVANSLPDMSVYKPKLFTTTALQQAKVNLTWDETNPDRIQTIQQAFSNAELAEMDLKAYLASSSSDEEEEKTKDVAAEGEDCSTMDDQIAKYRSLLLSLEEEESKKKEKDVEMEITWEPGLKGAAEELIKKKQKEKQTPFEEFLEKRKEKRKKLRKERLKQTEEPSKDEQQAFSDDEIPSDVDLNDPYFKEEMEGGGSKKRKKNKRQKVEDAKDPQAEAELQLLMMDEDDGKQHFNMKDLIEDETPKTKKKKKRLAKEKEAKPVDTFDVDVKDPRFSAVFSSPLFNIDPSDPNFKKTKGMAAFVQEKQKRRAAEPVVEEDGPSSAKISKQLPSEKDNLPSLVKSIKMKTQNFQKKMKQKKT